MLFRSVMYRGKLVETALAATLYGGARHPYAQLLLQSVPIPDPKAEAERRRVAASAEIVNREATDGGCPFAARCPRAQFPICTAQVPALGDKAEAHQAACHFA